MNGWTDEKIIDLIRSKLESGRFQHSLNVAVSAKYLAEKYGARIFIVPMENYDISSTMVRNSLEKGLDISEYVDGKVLEYIKEHNVFGSEK